jgi:hypothetical protein
VEAIQIAGFVIAVLALAIVLMITPVVAYVMWRYAVTPFRVMRADIVALNREVGDLRQQARVKVMSDEEVARTEARLNARQRVRMGVQ